MGWVNGLYQARGRVGEQTVLLDVRVDLKSTQPAQGGSGIGRVSVDVYLQRGARIPLFLSSYRSRLLNEEMGQVQISRIPLHPIEGFNCSDDTSASPARVFLTLDSHDSGAKTLVIEGIRGLEREAFGRVSMEVEPRGSELRELTVVFHRMDDVIDPRDLRVTIGGETHSLGECFREAGFRLVSAGGGDSDLPLRQGWEVRDLFQVAGITERSRGSGEWGGSHRLASRVHLLCVNRLAEDSRTVGWMFDRKRRVAAVFHDTLRDLVRTDSSLGSFSKNYLFTTIHELAHALNLPHCFSSRGLFGGDPGRNKLSFTNYPSNYTRGASGFWDERDGFGFRFDPCELIHIRHGARTAVLTGEDADDFRGGPLLPGDEDASSIGESAAGLSLTLRLREGLRDGAIGALPGDGASIRGNIFDFGEPVHVEAEIRSDLAEDRPLSRRLSVVTGDLVVVSRMPDGSVYTLEPDCHMCAWPEARILNADPRSPELRAFHKNLVFGFWTRPRGFLEPGRYDLRAVYRHGGSILLSNLLTIYIRYPSRDVENAVVPLLDESVGHYMAFRGVCGLEAATTRLTGVFGDLPTKKEPPRHALESYYRAYEGFLHQAQVLKWDAKSQRIDVSSGGGHALDWLTYALSLKDPADLRLANAASTISKTVFSNIELKKVALTLHSVLVESGDQSLADLLIRKVDSALEKRGVPLSVRKRVLPIGRPNPKRGNKPKPLPKTNKN